MWVQVLLLVMKLWVQDLGWCLEDWYATVFLSYLPNSHWYTDYPSISPVLLST